MKNINKVAVKFIKNNLKGIKTAEAVVSYLENQGFSVIFYTPEKHTNLLEAYKALEYSKSFRNFTVFGKTAKAVFILKTLSAEDKYIALLHETAHIVLGHILEDNNTANTRINELEAEAFVYAVLHTQTSKLHTFLSITGILALCMSLLILSINFNKTPSSEVVKPQEKEITETVIDTVYVAPSGTRFHTEGCFYIKNKNCTSLSRQEAIKAYSPCKVCNP